MKRYTILQSTLRCFALGLLVVYIGWQVMWLGQGKIPPSLFMAITGLPSATTGGTRSIISLSQGRWLESLGYHPLAIPIALLFVWSVGQIATQKLAGRQLKLSQRTAVSWAVLLVSAWIIQLVRAT